MNIVICGAGEVGRHAAEILAARNENVTVLDADPAKLSDIGDAMDVRVMQGNGTHAEDLIEAGVPQCDLFIAATSQDEINLLSASVAAAVGAGRTIARVHHGDYFERRGIDYAAHFGIDHLVCPEHSTAVAIAQTLRNPGALAVERFARGQIELQQIRVAADAEAVGEALASLKLPRAVRVALVERDGVAEIPTGTTVVGVGDVVTLVGEVEALPAARKMFHAEAERRQRLIAAGGSSLAVWLARALHKQNFSMRLLVADEDRAHELAEKLPWITVLHVDPANASVYEEERIDQADAFVAVSDDDEQNILSAARAKAMGVATAIAVLQRSTYLHLLKHVGIDYSFSPRVAAVEEIESLLTESWVRRLATLAVGVAEVFEVRVRKTPRVLNTPLREVRFPGHTLVAAIQRGDETHVPGPDDSLKTGDIAVIVAPADAVKPLREMFDG